MAGARLYRRQFPQTAAVGSAVAASGDEHRHDALGCAGNRAVRTSNLDRMAGDGGEMCWLARLRIHRTEAHFIPTYDVMRVRIDGTGLLRLWPSANRAIHGISDWSRDHSIIFSEWNRAGAWPGPVLVKPDGTGLHRVEALKGCAWVRWIPPLV